MHGVHGHRTFSWSYEPVPLSVPQARAFAADTADRLGWKDIRSLKVVVSELVTNAVATETWCTVTICAPYRQGGSMFIEVEVADGSPHVPTPRPLDPLDSLSENGRGLFLVTYYSSEITWESCVNGKHAHVTLEMEAPPDDSAENHSSHSLLGAVA